jgi:hypothetical protein
MQLFAAPAGRTASVRSVAIGGVVLSWLWADILRRSVAGRASVSRTSRRVRFDRTTRRLGRGAGHVLRRAGLDRSALANEIVLASFFATMVWIGCGCGLWLLLRPASPTFPAPVREAAVVDARMSAPDPRVGVGASPSGGRTNRLSLRRTERPGCKPSDVEGRLYHLATALRHAEAC